MNSQGRAGFGLFALVCAAVAGISVWSVFADPIINNDGIVYIRVAQALANGDMEAALSIHKWPFYSFLISLLHRVTGLDFITSAHVLNGLLNLLTCVIFIRMVAELGGSKAALVIAAFVIVLFPGLNELRSYIIRDHGYIAFYLLAFYFLVRALDVRRTVLLAAGTAAMAVATLFRIEGVVFLIAMPIIYLSSRPDATPLNKLTFYLITAIIFAILISVFGWWLYSPQDDTGRQSLFSLNNIQTGWSQANQYLDTKIEILKEKVLNTSSDSTGRLVFLWTVSGIIFTQVLITLSIPYAIFTFYALKNHLVFSQQLAYKPWKRFIFFNVLILAVFTLTKFFLTDRYPLALAVTLLLTVPFALDHIYQRWKAKPGRSLRHSWGYIIILLLLIANSYEGLTSYSDKHYLREAGLWIRDNVPEDYRLYTDNAIVGFYSGHSGETLYVEDKKDELIRSFYRGGWINFDYLALTVKPDPEYEAHLQRTMWVEPEKVFSNSKSREVRMVDIKKYRDREDQ